MYAKHTNRQRIGDARACTRAAGSSSDRLRVPVAKLPHGDDHAHELMRKDFHTEARLPPVVGIEIAVARGNYAQHRARRK